MSVYWVSGGWLSGAVYASLSVRCESGRTVIIGNRIMPVILP